METNINEKELQYKTTFNHASRIVLTIDNEGRLIPGKDLSMDEVTQGVFAALATTLPKYAEIDRLRGENERLREALKWYASDEAWTIDQVEGPYGDYGSKARAALQPK